jgi:beta-glucosidase/6-phospho-beta-glucosidase/beta-galactosidase
MDFERFARVCYERFGDQVKNWITLNEPWNTTINVSIKSILSHFPPLLQELRLHRDS